MNRFCIVLIVLFSVLHSNAQTKKAFPGITLYEYGFPCNDDCNHLRDSIANSWNISYELIAGCVVTSRFSDSISDLNEASIKRWNTYYNKDWNSFLSEKLDSIFVVQNFYKEESAILQRNRFSAFEEQIKLNFPNQNFQYSLNGFPNDSVMYIGFTNKLSITNPVEDSISFSGINCIIEPDSISHSEFFAHPFLNPSKSCTLIVYSNDEPIQIIKLSVEFLKPPKFCFGDVSDQAYFNFRKSDLVVCGGQKIFSDDSDISIFSVAFEFNDQDYFRKSAEIDDQILEAILNTPKDSSFFIRWKYEFNGQIRSYDLQIYRGDLPSPSFRTNESKRELELYFLDFSLLDQFIQVSDWSVEIDQKKFSGKSARIPSNVLKRLKHAENYTFHINYTDKDSNSSKQIHVTK